MRLARIAHVSTHFFASAVMAMIHDASANGKNVVTFLEEASSSKARLTSQFAGG